MRHLYLIGKFCWPYMRRYWVRLSLGMLLGVFFGLSNAFILGSAQTLLSRLGAGTTAAPAQAAEAVKAALTAAPEVSGWERRQQQWKDQLDQWVDPWLPRSGRPLDGRQILGVLLLMPALLGGRGLLGYFSTYCMAWVSERVINDLRLNVLKKLSSLSLDYFTRSTVGDMMMRVTGDTGAVHRWFSMGMADLVKEPITIVCVFAYLCWLDWRMTLIVLALVPTCIVPLSILGKKIHKASKGGIVAKVQQSSLLVEFLTSIRVIKAFDLEPRLLGRFQELSRDLIHHHVKGVKAAELINPLLETVAAFLVGLILVLTFFHQKSLPDTIIFFGALVAVYPSVKKVAALHATIQQTRVGVDRLQSIFDERPSVAQPATPKPLAAFAGEIRFEHVSFGYGSKPVLQDLSLTIPRGFRLGVAGVSGSGKSTLVNLLFRFYDVTSGRVTVDGLDVREIASRDLHRQMALVSQDTAIFDQTVADNIGCGKEGATRAEVEAAARFAFAEGFIRAMPAGFDTRVAERGATLSGGQRQRICIARAVVRDAPILVLDEATASLDSESEAEVQRAIERLAENRTVVCVAHRLSTLAQMDRIIVLEEGRIVEEGTFKELLARGGRFADMARHQNIHGAGVTAP